MNPISKAIDIYEANRQNLHKRLTQVGGNAELILSQNEWCKVMKALACNNLRVNLIEVEDCNDLHTN